MADRLELHDATWQRVSLRLIVSEYVGAVTTAVFFIAAALIFSNLIWSLALWLLAPIGVITVIALVLIPRRVKSIGYQLRSDDLLFRRGILYQRFVAVPYGRMQLVDINRGPLSRMLGLSELKFVTAAASTGVTIPGLRAADAVELRDQLVALAETRRAGL
ncbi:MAG: PH domain-containing protein [Microbacteriaceae bacterium]|nr:PH domain-containing protein [Microbacteriaceae bacterium]